MNGLDFYFMGGKMQEKIGLWGEGRILGK